MAKITAVVATSIDGKIAAHKDQPSDWTSPEDKDFLRSNITKADVLIMGNNTFKTHKDRLTKQNCIIFTKSVTVPKKENQNLLFCNPLVTNIEKLLKRYREILVLGGTQTYSYFLEKNLLDEICITVEPIIFGKGLNIFETTSDLQQKFTLQSTEKINNQGTLLLKYSKIP